MSYYTTDLKRAERQLQLGNAALPKHIFYVCAVLTKVVHLPVQLPPFTRVYTWTSHYLISVLARHSTCTSFDFQLSSLVCLRTMGRDIFYQAFRIKSTPTTPTPTSRGRVFWNRRHRGCFFFLRGLRASRFCKTGNYRYVFLSAVWAQARVDPCEHKRKSCNQNSSGDLKQRR